MKKYRISGRSANFHSGVMALSEEQASARSHALEPVEGKEGLYKILTAIQFKRGETVGYDGEVSKLLATEIEPVEAKKEAGAKPGKPPGKKTGKAGAKPGK